MNTPLYLAYRAATEWIDGLNERPVAARATLQDLRQRFGGRLPKRGSCPEEVVGMLATEAGVGMNGSASGRFYAWVIGGALQSALAADWLAAAWDQNAGNFATSPSASVIEETAGEWIKELL